MSDLESLGDSLGGVFRRLGIPDPVRMADLVGNWDVIVGQPWANRSKPLVVEGTRLVVEAATPSTVAFLRYSMTDLLKTLDERLGVGVITEVEVRAPRRP